MKDFNIKLGVQNIPIKHESKEIMEDLFEDLFDEEKPSIIGSFTAQDPSPSIYLWNKLIGGRYIELFIHELIEAINSQYDIELNHTQIGVLGATLSQVLQDNNLRFLTEREVDDEKV